MDFRLNADTCRCEDASGLMQLPTFPLPKPGIPRLNRMLCSPEEDVNCVDPLFHQRKGQQYALILVAVPATSYM